MGQNENGRWGLATYRVTRTSGESRTIHVKGRVRWALQNLIAAGPEGCTPIDHPGPRWAAYVHRLRTECGVEIETVNEKHGGDFEGTHARYVLRSKVVRILAQRDGGKAA